MSITGYPNILLIIADDLGKDAVSITDSGASRKMQVVTNDGSTDIIGELLNVSRFLRNGLYFDQAWAQPACSPTRASIYTGTHPWKNGIGNPLKPQLPASTVISLPEVLPNEYACGLFGKWHLGDQPGNRPPDHGWDKHVGTLAGIVPDYYNWTKDNSDNYETCSSSITYVTQDTVDEAATWVKGLDPETPWFATIAFHTPHDPFHEPPDGYDPTTVGDSTTPDYKFNLMVQNMDSNIGRLIGMDFPFSSSPDIEAIPEEQLRNTVIIFIGDNGSPQDIALEEAKVTIYEGGVRIPMIIADGLAIVQEYKGESINPFCLHANKLNCVTHHLVHVVDLYATITKIGGGPKTCSNTDIDSFSLTQLFKNKGAQPEEREYNFSQFFVSIDEFDVAIKRATIRNHDYKLNYQAAKTPNYQLFKYVQGEVPGLENDGATDIYDDALNGENSDAQENLNALLNELIEKYRADATTTFPDPRPQRWGVDSVPD